MKPVPEEIQNLLKTVANHFDQEDRAARERQLRSWRRLKLLWEGFTRVWYSEVAHDWRIYEDDSKAEDGNQAYYDKPINVFRAYLESIIAALSITVPGIKCYPNDADNPLDLSTAKAGDRIALLLGRHNDVSMLWLHALYIMCTEGMLACYSYPKEDESYGIYKEDKYEDVAEDFILCPSCGEKSPVEAGETLTSCPECGYDLTNVDSTTQTSSRLVDSADKFKSRICMECYGGLYVKVPNYAMRQADVPYLIFSYETHYTNAVDRYSHLKDKFTGESRIGPSGGGMYDPYEQWARLSPQYKGEYPVSNVTVRNTWLRPSSFNVLGNQADVELLKKHYPDGVKVVLVNDEFAEACGEKLDDCWTILYNPLSDYIHQQPLGSLLVNVQDITNDIISLTLQTIEHGISQTFADPSVLNFDKYRQSEATPGSVYPAVAKTGKSVGDGFFETRTATLSSEILPFFERIQGLGQTVSGAQPSLFGGQLTGSRTASEYSMSRAQALQRLQNVWKMLTIWWKEIFSKAIPMYIEEIRDDERSVEVDEQGNFINVFVRRAELEGKIGRIELEANENLPITWSQRKDVYMQLLESQNPHVLQALASPENIRNLAEAIGLDDFIVPGDADRQKQYEEIRALINSEPILQPPDPNEVMMAIESGMPPPEDVEVSSVEIDPDLDNHDIEADICRTYLISEAGRLLRIENPVAYKNILLHMKAHMQMVKQSMADQAMSGQQAEQPEGTSTPLAENEDVAAES
jgi:uncharacterized CHY-type Zn-finger protein